MHFLGKPYAKSYLKLIFLIHVLRTVCSVLPFRYRATEWLYCDTVNTPYLKLWNTPLWKCVHDCVVRVQCRAVNYNRQRRLCKLFSIELNGIVFPLKSKSCVYVKKSEVDIPAAYIDGCQNCAVGKSCMPDNYNCIYKECASLEIKYAAVHGNMISVDAVVRIVPISGFELDSDSSKSKCQANGTWSSTPTSAFQGTCESGWLKIYKSCYKFRTDRVTFNSAKSTCSAANAHMVTMETPEENAALEDFLLREYAGNSGWWIGINDMAVEGVWVYTYTNTPLSFSNWGEIEPNDFGPLGEDCAQILHSNTKWIDVRCGGYHGKIICEKSVDVSSSRDG